MANKKQRQQVFDHWNSRGIVVHKKITHDLELEIGRVLNSYSPKEVCALIDFYATILEPGVPDREKKYFWSHKWNLWEFLHRGVRKFDGQEVSNYLREQHVDAPEAVVFTRNKKDL